MNTALILLITYFAVMNLMGYMIMANDKTRAKKQEYRIKESSIWKAAFLGGAVGCFAGMKMFRHKTKHTVFRYGLPAISAAQLISYSALAFIILQK
ncbi:MAG: DUF1294 domain-containing protein [Bacillota bacterium]